MATKDVSATVSFKTTQPAGEDAESPIHQTFERRSFLKGLGVVGATLSAGTLLTGESEAEDSSITRGDAAILRFAAAAEILETDLWQQYAELGGTQNAELPGLTGGSPLYTQALQQLDGDMDQYISDNTEDELTHEQFINAYLISKGADPVNLDAFRTLPSSKATGAQQIGRLTNLMQLTVDTTWWTRYRSRTKNPDLHDSFAPAIAGFPRTAAPVMTSPILLARDGFVATLTLNRSDKLNALTPPMFVELPTPSLIWTKSSVQTPVGETARYRAPQKEAGCFVQILV